MNSGNSKSKLLKIDREYFFEKSFPKENQIQFYNEFFIHNYLTNFSKEFTVPLFKKDIKNLKLIYQYMPKTKELNKIHFKKYLELIKKIHLYTNNGRRYSLYAKEALINNKICITQIKEKLFRHKQNKINFKKSVEYKLFLKEFERCFNRLIPYLEKIRPKSKHNFSHADSGIHNCILDQEYKIRLVDFEYAGFDSPIKQHIDFLVHPKNVNDNEIIYEWSNYFLNEKICKYDQVNLNIYNALFSLKWSLIIINEFLSDNWNVRVYANPKRKDNRDRILITQLKKANLYLIASIKLLENEPIEKIFSKSEKLLISKSY